MWQNRLNFHRIVRIAVCVGRWTWLRTGERRDDNPSHMRHAHRWPGIKKKVKRLRRGSLTLADRTLAPLLGATETKLAVRI
jgi:hypothetical protein